MDNFQTAISPGGTSRRNNVPVGGQARPEDSRQAGRTIRHTKQAVRQAGNLPEASKQGVREGARQSGKEAGR